VTGPPPLSDLFLGFMRVALSGFGGVVPWARRMIVDEKHWMSDADFVDLYALGRAAPGPNMMIVTLIGLHTDA
jgi:chromate transporter